MERGQCLIRSWWKPSQSLLQESSVRRTLILCPSPVLCADKGKEPVEDDEEVNEEEEEDEVRSCVGAAVMAKRASRGQHPAVAVRNLCIVFTRDCALLTYESFPYHPRRRARYATRCIACASCCDMTYSRRLF